MGKLENLEIKNSRATMGTGDRKGSKEMNDSRTDFNIASLLLQGSENGISAHDLCSTLGTSDARFIRKLISDERQNGTLILSNAAGYFLPERTTDGQLTEKAYIELMQSYHLLRSMAIGTLKSARTMRLAIKEYEEHHGRQ